MTKASKRGKRPQRPGASTGVARAADGDPSSSEGTTTGASPRLRATGQSGVPGSKNDSRRCTATANRTGERCRAPAIKGGTVCRVHGGSLPQVKNKAKERLLELVDPALAALHKVLSDPHADDSVKVRASLGILDRTGFRPGVDVTIGVSKFDSMFDGITEVGLDRSLSDAETRPAVGGGGRDPMPLGFEDVEQAVVTAREDAWRTSGYDAEDAPPEHPYRDENTVTGEVIQSRYDVPPDRPPTDPPRYVDEEARRADGNPT